MDVKESNCIKCNGDIIDTRHCPKCSASLKFLKTSSSLGNQVKQESNKTTVKPMETNYVTQIVSSGIRPDNVYEVQHNYFQLN